MVKKRKKILAFIDCYFNNRRKIEGKIKIDINV